MNARHPSVALRAGYRCEYCRAPEAVFNFPFEVEHIVPESRGGADGEENLALACRACNLYKAAEVTGIDPKTGDHVLLFDPRAEAWRSHFAVSEAEGSIDGLTPIGRATIAQLRMNMPAQLVARRHWVRLGLYP